MNEQRMRFAIGVLTLVAGFALAALIVWFGEFQIALEPTTTYYVVMENALGAEPGIPVRRAGIRIGEVTDVEYWERESVVGLTIVLEDDNLLRDGDEPSLRAQGLLGDTYLAIETRPARRGQADREPYPAGATLEGRPMLDFSETLSDASELAPNANRTLQRLGGASEQWTEVGGRVNRLLAENEQRLNVIVDDTRRAIERLNVTLESINSVLDPQTQENLRVTIANLRDSSEGLDPLIASSQEAIEQITDTTVKLQEVADNLSRSTAPLAERSDSIVANLDSASERLDAVLGDAEEIVRTVREQDGTIQRLARDPSLYQNLDDAAALLTGALAELDPILRDLSVFADKIARHPGELGVQGVLTRDRGAKEIPPSQLQTTRKPGLFGNR